VDRDALLLTRDSGDTPEPLRIEADDLLLRLRDGSRLLLSPTTLEGSFPDGKMEIKVDAEKIKFPLLLRPWKNGDVFHPLGMDGRRQKLQDFFTNQKLSRHAKTQVLVLENADGAIIWVLGLRPDERFKIAPATRSALRLAWLI
jgi:tRNA(Ile)-lysidine synthase